LKEKTKTYLNSNVMLNLFVFLLSQIVYFCSSWRWRRSAGITIHVWKSNYKLPKWLSLLFPKV